MRNEEHAKYFSLCVDSDIRIYPKPSNTGKYKIIINRRGVEKVGDEIYEDKPYIKEVSQKTTTGVVKLKVVVPSVWDKINELYREICIKNKLVKEL